MDIKETILTIVSSGILLFLGARIEKSKLQSSNFLGCAKEELDYVISPLYKKFNYENEFTSKNEFKIYMEYIIYNHPYLIPKYIEIEYENILNKDESDKYKYCKMKQIINSEYNYLRKALGYPYNRDKIDKKLIDRKGTYRKFTILKMVGFSTMAVLVVIFKFTNQKTDLTWIDCTLFSILIFMYDIIQIWDLGR